jgi:hypothetical protein
MNIPVTTAASQSHRSEHRARAVPWRWTLWLIVSLKQLHFARDSASSASYRRVYIRYASCPALMAPYRGRYRPRQPSARCPDCALAETPGWLPAQTGDCSGACARARTWLITSEGPPLRRCGWPPARCCGAPLCSQRWSKCTLRPACVGRPLHSSRGVALPQFCRVSLSLVGGSAASALSHDTCTWLQSDAHAHPGAATHAHGAQPCERRTLQRVAWCDFSCSSLVRPYAGVCAAVRAPLRNHGAGTAASWRRRGGGARCPHACLSAPATV